MTYTQEELDAQVVRERAAEAARVARELASEYADKAHRQEIGWQAVSAALSGQRDAVVRSSGDDAAQMAGRLAHAMHDKAALERDVVFLKKRIEDLQAEVASLRPEPKAGQ
jgi:hypothetical protein